VSVSEPRAGATERKASERKACERYELRTKLPFKQKWCLVPVSSKSQFMKIQNYSFFSKILKNIFLMKKQKIHFMKLK